MHKFKDYEEFSNYMLNTFPKMYGEHFGFEIGKGWWPMLASLSRHIQGHINWRAETIERLMKNPSDRPMPEKVPQVVVLQIKEKFGGLRFYYNGGDDKIAGMVQMTEAWCGHTCESCGEPGEMRQGGWLRTLCDKHAKELNDDE